MNRVPVYILAGGQSSRFGSDKARGLFKGMPLIKHTCQLLAPVASTTTVVAERADQYADLGLRTIGDLQPGLGPLAGLQTALNDLPDDQDWQLMCPCDAVIIEPHWLKQLLTAADSGSQAIAFRDDHWQPMPALYNRSCLAVVEEHLQQKQLSMQQLLDRLDTKQLTLPDDWPDIWQINTPDELDRLAGCDDV